MASSGLAITQYVYAFIAASALPKTGDAANITVKVVADGVAATPAGAVTEVDATNCPGLYSVALLAAENTGFGMALAGKSSTIGVAVTPTTWTNEKLPTGAAGAAGGLLISGSNAGTTTLGALTVTGATTLTGGLVAAITGNITGNLSGSVGSVTGAVGSVTGNVGGNVGGDIVGNVDGNLLGTLTTTERNAVADALLDRANAIETAITPRLALRYGSAALAGVLSGAATSTVTIKGVAVATTRVVATVDIDGNRSAVVLS